MNTTRSLHNDLFGLLITLWTHCTLKVYGMALAAPKGLSQVAYITRTKPAEKLICVLSLAQPP